jgi:hypothetical protein
MGTLMFRRSGSERLPASFAVPTSPLRGRGIFLEFWIDRRGWKAGLSKNGKRICRD